MCSVEETSSRTYIACAQIIMTVHVMHMCVRVEMFPHGNVQIILDQKRMPKIA